LRLSTGLWARGDGVPGARIGSREASPDPVHDMQSAC
jgi:hypothetical protein